ncbi:BTAD domain-containing putative transcriptional regulator [Streptomyces sp. GbtcB6]|uniref:BTAD domain-containing putative transcriptional regulator n=1 Tax=Streptomyces sp. GbtcB6 TaxID=2824751 RepID=UPI001C30D0D7|nr:BTAD domain-containing putative transcriptional regulator [Streptomyces sp. GbtcB6]
MRFRLLGPLELLTDRGAVVLPGVLSRAIVARLLLARGAVVQRDTLIDDLWAEREAKDPVNALQVQVTKLRSAFAAQGEGERLLSRHGGYQVDLRPEDELDTLRFETAVRRGHDCLKAGAYREAETALREGLSLWRGRVLDDLEGRAFGSERSRLEDLRLGALEDVAAAGLELGRAEQLVPELKALVAVSPLRERLRERLMLALYRSGRLADALEVYEEGRRLLRAELGVVPSLELRSLHAALVRHDPSVRAPGAVNAVTVDVASPAKKGNLGRPLGPFVGRRGDLEGLCEAVGRERLVTVVGPGGVGKTRLVLEAGPVLESSCDGVWWVDLASTEEAGVLPAVAGALGLSDASVRPDQPPHDYAHRRLASFFAGRDAVLALDNCEHVLDAVAPLAGTLLGSCPSLRVVTTSRAPLGTRGEVLYQLAPMPETEAADLFAARAVMIDPSFLADEAGVRDIRSLCRRLDGLPLAVELAAAHVRLLSVREIEARLDNRFALLTKGERTAPARHRTLRAVLDWSYALLDVTEQRVLTELALYVGGCSVEVAETAVALDAECRHELLPVLAQLVDKSLLFSVPTPHGNRLRMLETVREYALARLLDEGRAAEAEERLMAWALDFVREGGDGIASGDQGEWVRRLTAESANIRAASDLMLDRSRTAQVLWLEARLGYYWHISGREEEGIERLQRGLQAFDSAQGMQAAAPTAEDERALFYTLAWLVWLNHVVGRHAEARTLIDRFRTEWRQAKNPDLAVLGPCFEPMHAMLNGQDDVAELFTLAEKGVEGTDFHWDRTVLYANWSFHCLQHGDVEGARSRGLAAVSAARAASDDFARAFSLVPCGDAEESGGLRDRAREHWTEAARILRRIGARALYAYTALRIACLDIAEGAFDAAGARLAELDRLADELSADDLRAATAILRAVLALHDRRLSDARRIFSSVWNSPMAPLDRRAVSAVGLAVVATSGLSAPSASDDVRMWLERAHRAHARVLEPLAHRAVAVLLDEVDACHRSGPGHETAADRVHEWLSGNPFVMVCFSGVLNGPGRHR